METAGTAVAHAAARWLGNGRGKRLLTLAGKGNNGGDAIIASRVLSQEHGLRPTLYLLAERGAAGDADPLLDWTAGAGVQVLRHGSAPAQAALPAALHEADVVLDGILGLGGRLPLQGPIAEVLARCREIAPPHQRRIAVDVPTGVQSDTGAADERAFRAHLTLCTGPAKVGLFIHPGAALAGRVQALEIGLPAAGGPPSVWRLEEAEVAGLLPARPDDSNKGTFGKVLVVAGSARYVGAAALAAGAAVRAGAGLVTLAVPATVQRAVAGTSPEATYLPLPDDPHTPGLLHPGHAEAILDAADGYDALAIGPGVGDHPQTQRLVLDLAARLAGSESAPPVVFDADALNALAAAGEWPRPPIARWVLTPHPGEMGRLRRRTVAEVQGDRLETALASARDWGQVVVLKGAPSIISAPDGPGGPDGPVGPSGRACLNPFANAVLATAGTGDVLTGTIAGLLAQGMSPFAAAGAGSYLHGLAGELWRASHGAAGLPASHLLALLPDALRRARSLR
jgi:ADP-dependent NAD(P)H-hydrate dehydratase / NAD(P)H-hydrate epimerase